jgi:hypothetical protein
MPRKVFVAGEILTAADVNTNLMDQAVMSFAGTAARGSAIPSPVEGMVTYLNDADRLEVYTNAWKPVGGVLQVVSTVKTNTFTTSSGTFTDVTDLSVTITPTSATSKILIQAFTNYSFTDNSNQAFFRVLRGSTPLAVGDASGSRISATFSSSGAWNTPGYGTNQATVVFLDSPNSTSALTYKVDCRRGIGGTLTVNRDGIDSDNANHGRTVSTITVMEIAG